jgi:hypothetical protein
MSLFPPDDLGPAGLIGSPSQSFTGKQPRILNFMLGQPNPQGVSLTIQEPPPSSGAIRPNWHTGPKSSITIFWRETGLEHRFYCPGLAGYILQCALVFHSYARQPRLRQKQCLASFSWDSATLHCADANPKGWHGFSINALAQQTAVIWARHQQLMLRVPIGDSRPECVEALDDLTAMRPVT